MTASLPGGTLAERRFQFVPLWGIMVFFLYAMRRISCTPCGKVVVEAVPCADRVQRFAAFTAVRLRRVPTLLLARQVGGQRTAAGMIERQFETKDNQNL